MLENIVLPLMSNQGGDDVKNEMGTYLVLSALAFVAIVLIMFIIYERPLPNTVLYSLAKLGMPLVTVLLIVSAIELVPINVTFSSVVIFVLHLFGVLISLLLSGGLFLNRKLTK
jgi:membrane associated rhomboid family serine protease